MTPDQFRRLALSLPDTSEARHMGHPDFRVHGKIFATLGYPDASQAMIRLSPEDQGFLVRSQPEVYQPVKGAWGQAGCTNVRLRAARIGPVREALTFAWEAASARPQRGGKRKAIARRPDRPETP
jgi:hypothetical protein